MKSLQTQINDIQDRVNALQEFVKLIDKMKAEAEASNLLAAKLYYTNKLFAECKLTEFQKRKVVDQLDASNLLAAKLYYTNTLFAECKLTDFQKRRVVDQLDVLATLDSVQVSYATFKKEYRK